MRRDMVDNGVCAGLSGRAAGGKLSCTGVTCWPITSECGVIDPQDRRVTTQPHMHVPG